jgi:hypothetical protein
MCSSHAPLEGADSYADTLDRSCTSCGGTYTTRDFEPHTCSGRVLCGSCGELRDEAVMERLHNGRYEWARCFDCRWVAQLRYEKETAA